MTSEEWSSERGLWPRYQARGCGTTGWDGRLRFDGSFLNKHTQVFVIM